LILIVAVINIYIGQVSNNRFMSKKRPDLEKIKKIRRALKENPNGLWVREIARRSKLTKSTVSKYINDYMKNEIEDIWKGGFIRIVRLRK